MNRSYRTLFVMLTVALLHGLTTFAAEKKVPWHEEAAPLRFRVALTDSPSVSSAGYIANIPDGGIFPASTPVSVVYDENGSKIDSYCLHYHRKRGFTVLFKEPKSGRTVYVYIKKGAKTNTFTYESGMTPSTLLFIQHGRADMSIAKKQLIFGPAKSDKSEFKTYRTWIWKDVEKNKKSPIDITWSITAAHGPGQSGVPLSLHMTGYLNTVDPGKTWVVASAYLGNDQAQAIGGGGNKYKSEIYIDGKRIVADQKRSDKPGGMGMEMNLEKGLHKIEVFMAGPPYTGFGFSWRTPNTEKEDMGGIRNEATPHAGTPQWEVRMLTNEEVMESGEGKVRAAEARDGGPVAVVDAKPLEILWFFARDTPQLAYSLKALTEGNPEDTVYSWKPTPEAEIKDKKAITWMYPAYKHSSATLTATSGDKTSTTTVPFFTLDYSMKTSVNDPSARAVFRNAYLNMLRAYPEDQDPTANWSKTMWDTLMHCMEIGQSSHLLAEIFNKRWGIMKKVLSKTDRWFVEDMFYEWMAVFEPETCLKWVEKTQKGERDQNRRKDLKVMQAELYMYELNDLEKAKKILQSAATGLDEVSQVAKVRLGDLELMSTNMNAAIKLYGRVQNSTKIKDDFSADPEGAASLQWSGKPSWRAGTGKDGGKNKTAEDYRVKKKKKTHYRALGGVTGRTPLRRPQEKIDDWKKNAVLDTGASETVKTLLEQGFYKEAQNVLDRWERNFPLSKLSSDYLIHEADLLIKLKNYKRARGKLKAYFDNVEHSNYMPDIIERLYTCMRQTKATKEEKKAFAKKAMKHLEFHPLGKVMEKLLETKKPTGRGIELDNTKREATSDQL